MEPICRIHLPSHHPAVAGLKKGESVHIVATKHEPDTDMPGMDKGPKVTPLETPFHVTAINKGGKAAAAPAVRSSKGKAQSPVEYLASRRGQPAGAKVSQMT